MSLYCFGEIDDVQLDAELLGRPQRVVALGFLVIRIADRVSVSLDAEACEEVQPFDVNAFFYYDFGGEHRIEAA